MDSINDQLIEAVRALGGSKIVGPMMWPQKSVDAAQRALLDALNTERPNRLDPEQMLFILRRARQAGHHGAAEWLMKEIGYAPPVPIAPRDEVAELQRQYIEAVRELKELAGKIEKASPGVRQVA